MFYGVLILILKNSQKFNYLPAPTSQDLSGRTIKKIAGVLHKMIKPDTNTEAYNMMDI